MARPPLGRRRIRNVFGLPPSAVPNEARPKRTAPKRVDPFDIDAARLKPAPRARRKR